MAEHETEKWVEVDDNPLRGLVNGIGLSVPVWIIIWIVVEWMR